MKLKLILKVNNNKLKSLRLFFDSEVAKSLIIF